MTNLGTKKQVTYKIVSEKEADLKAGKISVTSPIGKGILGKNSWRNSRSAGTGRNIEI